MDKIKFADGTTIGLLVNGITSTDKVLRLSMIANGTDLLAVEKLVSDTDNVSRVELLSENDEVLGIYNSYTEFSAITKKKDVVLCYVPEYSEDGEYTGENAVIGDAIFISLRKPDEVEARLTSLEESVDILTMASLDV